MDKKNTILYFVIGLAILTSLGFSFHNYIILRQYNTVIEQDPDAYYEYFGGGEEVDEIEVNENLEATTTEELEQSTL